MTEDAERSKVWDRALVTGASAGIGEAIARELAAAGTSLVVVARSGDRLEALAGELEGGPHGIEVEVLVADLADAEQLARVEKRVAADEQPIDLLVNNAGFGFNGNVGEIPIEDEQAEILVNVLAVVRLSTAAVQAMRPRRHGSILNVGSVAGFQPAKGSANYSATKAYVLSYTQSLDDELAGSGVNATVLCPGFTHTEFQDRGEFDVSGLPSWFWQDADVVARTGLDAAASGRTVVVPGLHNRAAVVLTRHIPHSVVRRFSGAVMDRL
jgi:short-subunit dehydrogenase